MARKQAGTAPKRTRAAQDASGEGPEGFGSPDGPDAGKGRPISSGEPWRNRIVAYGPALVSQIVANPKNWRMHPPEQYAALEASLGIGIVQNVIINRTTGNLVDGHARVTLAMRNDMPSIPATFVELSQREEEQILLALDPLAGMAKASNEQLAALLRDQGDIEGGSLVDLVWSADMREPLLAAEWSPGPAGELPDREAGGQGHSIKFTNEQWDVAWAAITRLREDQQAPDLTPAQALERLARLYVEGQP